MSTTVAHDLNQDQSFVSAVWLGNKTAVINHLLAMMEDGWYVTVDGLVSHSKEHGLVIARPLKIKGELESTGVGIFKFKNSEL